MAEIVEINSFDDSFFSVTTTGVTRFYPRNFLLRYKNGKFCIENNYEDGYTPIVNIDLEFFRVNGVSFTDYISFQQAILPIINSFDTNLTNVLDVIEENTSLASSNTHLDITQTTTSVLFVASNPNRKELIIRNDAQGNQKLYIGFNNPATLNNAIFLSKDEIYIEDKYTGDVYGVWDGNGSGFARIEENIS